MLLLFNFKSRFLSTQKSEPNGDALINNEDNPKELKVFLCCLFLSF